MNPMIKPHIDDQAVKGANDAMSACSLPSLGSIPGCKLFERHTIREVTKTVIEKKKVIGISSVIKLESSVSHVCK